MLRKGYNPCPVVGHRVIGVSIESNSKVGMCSFITAVVRNWVVRTRARCGIKMGSERALSRGCGERTGEWWGKDEQQTVYLIEILRSTRTAQGLYRARYSMACAVHLFVEMHWSGGEETRWYGWVAGDRNGWVIYVSVEWDVCRVPATVWRAGHCVCTYEHGIGEGEQLSPSGQQRGPGGLGKRSGAGG